MAHPPGVATATIDAEAQARRTTAWSEPVSLLLMAVWFGLAAGLLELVFLVVRVRAFEKSFFLRSTHFVWMVPLSDLAIFGSWGILLTLACWLRWRLPTRWVLGSFLFLACVSQLSCWGGAACILLRCRAAVRRDRLPGGLVDRASADRVVAADPSRNRAVDGHPGDSGGRGDRARLVRSPPAVKRAAAHRLGRGPERPVDRAGYGPG